MIKTYQALLLTDAEIDASWFANWNGLEYRIRRAIGGDVFVERPDGSDVRMLMIEKFRRSFHRA